LLSETKFLGARRHDFSRKNGFVSPRKIRVFDDAGNLIEMHEQRRVSKTDRRLDLLLWRID
jgi:hypothetical protein